MDRIPSGWTAERIEILTTMWRAGRGAPAIMKVLDLTRGAVIGKAHRLGLGGEGAPSYINNQGRPRPVFKAAPKAANPPAPKPAPPPPRERDEDGRLEAFDIPDPVAAEEAGEPIVLVDLDHRTCRYPVSTPPAGDGEDTLFCGALPRPGSPYCSPHAERCYSPAGLAKLSRLARVDGNVRTGRPPAPAGDVAPLDRLFA